MKYKRISFLLVISLLLSLLGTIVSAETVFEEEQRIFTYEDLAGISDLGLDDGEIVKAERIEGANSNIESSIAALGKSANSIKQYYIILYTTGMLLTNPSGTTFSLTRYHSGGANHTIQKWLFVDDGNGSYVVCPESDSSKCLTINPATLQVTLGLYMGSPYQKWGIYVSSQGNFLRSEATGTAVDGYKLVINSSSCYVSNTAYTRVGFFDTTWYIPTQRIGQTAFYLAPEQTKTISLSHYPDDAICSNNWINWSVSNSNISVDTGVVTGEKANTTAILYYTDRITQASGSCTVTVTAFAEGTYFLRNKQTTYYADIDLANNSIVHQWSLHEGYQERWVLRHLGDGYYSIQSARTDIATSYLSVQGDSTATNHPIVIRAAASTSALTNGMKWKFEETSSGSYKIIPQSGETLGRVLSTSTSSATTGDDLLQTNYVADTVYRDEWNLIRMLPTSGSEVAYDESLWNYTPVCGKTNCYAYALNTQVEPGTNKLWFAQPGIESDFEPYSQSEISADLIVRAVESDAEEFEFTFVPIGRYAKCPAGAYKVALVIDNGVDYHWYRQNPNGFWSHKLAGNPITKRDASDQLIIDPWLADRDHGSTDYDIFVGYFAITPLNEFYE